MSFFFGGGEGGGWVSWANRSFGIWVPGAFGPIGIQRFRVQGLRFRLFRIWSLGFRV